MTGHVVSDGKGKWKIIIEAGKDPATGKRKRIIRRVKGRKSDAEGIMVQLLSELKGGSYIEPSRITVGEWLDTWLNDYKKIDLRLTTWESYEVMARVHIKPVLGALPLQDLRPEHLQKLYSDKLKEGKSSRTVRYIHQVMHGALDQAIKNKLISGQNVSELTTLPSLEQRQVRAMTPEEQTNFLQHIKDHRLGAAFLVLIGTGMRRGELLGLRWSDVDLNEGIINVRQGVVWTREGIQFNDPKTKKSKRSFSVPQIILDQLKIHKEKMQAEGFFKLDGPVFCSAAGTTILPHNFNKSFLVIRKKLGIEDINIHALRHTFATRMLEAGVSMKEVQELLGHAKIAMTADIYSHVSPELKKASAQKMNDILSGTNDTEK